jgi:hypothetical protein
MKKIMLYVASPPQLLGSVESASRRGGGEGVKIASEGEMRGEE